MCYWSWTGHGDSLDLSSWEAREGDWWSFNLSNSLSCRIEGVIEVEAWHYKESLGDIIGGGAAHLQQKTTTFGDPIIMGWSWRTAPAVEWKQLEPGRKAVCAEDGRDRDVTSAPGRIPKDHELFLDTGHWITYMVGVWFYFVQIGTGFIAILLLSTWSKKVLLDR